MLTITKRLLAFLLFSGILFFVQSCTDDDPGPKEVLLTVEIEPGYFQSDFDAWIFISDKNGKPIDAREVTDSTHVQFLGAHQGSLTMNIMVHVVDTSSPVAWHSFGVNSYQEIVAGSTIQLKTGTSSNIHPPEVIGSAPFVLEDYSDSDKPEEALIITDGVASAYTVLDYSSSVYSGTNFSSELNLRENPSDVLLATYHDNVPVYKWLTDLEPAESVAVSFDTFVPSTTITIDKHVALGTVKQMKGADYATGYIFSDLYSWQISKSSDLTELPKLGYLDGFDKYFVSVVQNQLHEKVNLYYTKAGTIPTSISMPDFSYSINNDNLFGLSIDFSNPYEYKEAYFIKSSSELQVNWTLHASDEENFKAPSLPSEIKKAFPMLNVDGLNLQFAAFTHCLDGYTYSDYVRDHLALDPRDVYEELRYVVGE